MSTIATKPLPGTSIDPDYPDSDGEPMGESGFHVEAILHLFSALKNFFRQRDDVHVAADMFLYYERGKPSACKAPDVMVTFGVVGNHLRRSFRTWEEGVAPAVIFEVTSRKTRREDEIVKPQVYASLGVKEYFRFDPEGDSAKLALAGYRLHGGVYRPLEFNQAGMLTSLELGTSLEAEFPFLRLTELRTGCRLLSDIEMGEQLVETQRILGAERSRVEAQRLIAEAEHERAEAEHERAEAERERANAESKRVAELETELARLRAERKQN